jgi:hypothetical protein
MRVERPVKRLVPLLALVACAHGTPHPGTVAGSLAPCYGPAFAGDNLRPQVTVAVWRGGRVVTTGTFAVSNDLHEYRFTLPPGTYVLRARGFPDVTARVRADRTTTANLVAPPCL